jgi:hypothetical protein
MEDKKKIWLLRPVEGLAEDNSPWDPWYDKAFGFVVVAYTEAQAREIANTNGGDEKYESSYGLNRIFDKSPTVIINVWLDSKYTTCIELTPDYKEELVMRDFARG